MASPDHPTLTADECWSQLRRHREGRLGYLTGRGPRHVVLPYTVCDGQVVVRVPAYNEATQYAGGREVTFDVTSRTTGSVAERIEVVGRGRLGDPEGAVIASLPDEHWPADLPSRLVWLQVENLRGELEPDDR